MKRRNPSKLAAARYQAHPEILRPYLEAAPVDQTLDEALEMLEALTGERQEREAVLYEMSEYVLANFSDARDAMRWILDQDRYIGSWCCVKIAQMINTMSEKYLDSDSEVTHEAILVAEQWFDGRASSRDVKKEYALIRAFAYELANDEATTSLLVSAANCVEYGVGTVRFIDPYRDFDGEWGRPSIYDAAGSTVQEAMFLLRAAVNPTNNMRLLRTMANAILTYPEMKR